jgi:hypothetical protein
MRRPRGAPGKVRDWTCLLAVLLLMPCGQGSAKVRTEALNTGDQSASGEPRGPVTWTAGREEDKLEACPTFEATTD